MLFQCCGIAAAPCLGRNGAWSCAGSFAACIGEVCMGLALFLDVYFLFEFFIIIVDQFLYRV